MKARVLRGFYQFVVPGGVVLLASAWAASAGMLQNVNPSFWRYYPYVIFGVGLLLSAAFNRSRLFFALLIVALADRAFIWLTPRLSEPGVHRAIFDAIALLLPLNLLTLSLIRDRGIVSARGRRRIAFIAAQLVLVALIIFVPSVQVRAASVMHQPIVPPQYSAWSRMSQPALLAFLLAALVMLVYLLERRRPVERGLFWALVTAFIALNAGGANHLSSAYFATGGLILAMAVLETSYAMAYHDELTHLPSRRALNEALLKMENFYTVAMVDVDHFKQFNDKYGHETGDQVLQMIASRMSDVTGGGKAFRYGGEEFAVIFPNKPLRDAYPSLESLRKSVENSDFMVRIHDRRRMKETKRKKSHPDKKRVMVTVSIGVAAVGGQKVKIDDAMRAADKALYRAKSNGRNCIAASQAFS